MAISDLFALPTAAQARASIIATAESAGLRVTSWIIGSPAERWIEIAARVIDAFGSTITTQAIRGFFLDIATDPGDPGDLSADQTPRAGWLSGLGEGWYGTTRRGQTLATGVVTVTNIGTSPATFAPFDLTFQRSTADPSDGGLPTYRNTDDPTIYRNLDGTVTIAALASRDLPIVAEQIGTYADAAPAEIVSVVTQSFGSLSCTNGGPVLAQDRESADDYRARCRLAVARLSHGGPADAYRYAATTALDGTPLQRHDGSGPCGITRVWVQPDSALGGVQCYFADDDGPAANDDVDSANANIRGEILGSITNPIGVVPMGASYEGVAANPKSVVVTGSVKVKIQPGGLTGSALVSAVRGAIINALAQGFAEIPIGGFDNLGVGHIYKNDLEAVVRSAYPGLYNVTLATPTGASASVALNEVAVVKTFASLGVSATAPAGGLIRIETAGTHGLATGTTIYIADVTGTTEANGTWVITFVDPTKFTLNGSTFVNVHTGGGAVSCWSVTPV